MPSASGCGARWPSPIARCSATSGTRSGTSSGTGCTRAIESGELPRPVRRRAGGLRRGPPEALRQRRPPGLAGALRQQLRERPPVGGLRGDLGTLSAHRRHARDGGCLRSAGSPADRRRRRPQGGGRLRSLQGRERLPADRCLASDHRRPEQPQPLHGPARPLSLRARAGGHAKARLHPRARAREGRVS
jgi:hypothetical protein